MKIIINCLVLFLMITGCKTNTSVLDNFYPEETERITSDEYITYYINPINGNDENIGTKNAPWKTFKRVNQLILTKGNKIEIVAPGTFRESLFLIGQGTTEHPITVQFVPGKYNFYPENAFKSKFHISNSNDDPDSLKAVALYLSDSENINIIGNGADIISRGKAINMALIDCNNINVEGFSFDYHRPTISEMKVIAVTEHSADVMVHPDSKFKISSDSLITWLGEGWKDPLQSYWQEFDSASQKVIRKRLKASMMKFSEIDKNHLRIHFDKNPGLISGFTYQTRNTFRDYSAFLIDKSKNISWRNIDIYSMHGLGFVSQFCENIKFDSLVVKPKENSGRTSSAWGDILHFSSCKGNISITNSYLSATHDDPINIHGTHLKIVDVISKQKIKVRFMHPQTYGIDAFFVGDSIEFVSVKSLLPYARNKIAQVEKLNDKEFELTLSQTIPNNIQPNDVIENSTWTPDVTIQNIKLLYTPTRGILVTTKGKVVIENNEFIKTSMNAILIADDAGSWFESGYVRDVTIRNNKFIDCASPVINVHPENTKITKENPVHKNIRIINNQFKLDKNLLLSAKSTNNIKFSNNDIETNKTNNIKDLIDLKACSNVEIEGNQIKKTVTNKDVYKK